MSFESIFSAHIGGWSENENAFFVQRGHGRFLNRFFPYACIYENSYKHRKCMCVRCTKGSAVILGKDIAFHIQN